MKTTKTKPPLPPIWPAPARPSSKTARAMGLLQSNPTLTIAGAAQCVGMSTQTLALALQRDRDRIHGRCPTCKRIFRDILPPPPTPPLLLPTALKIPITQAGAVIPLREPDGRGVRHDLMPDHTGRAPRRISQARLAITVRQMISASRHAQGLPALTGKPRGRRPAYVKGTHLTPTLAQDLHDLL